jgi:hypothetical protein
MNLDPKIHPLPTAAYHKDGVWMSASDTTEEMRRKVVIIDYLKPDLSLSPWSLFLIETRIPVKDDLR